MYINASPIWRNVSHETRRVLLQPPIRLVERMSSALRSYLRARQGLPWLSRGSIISESSSARRRCEGPAHQSPTSSCARFIVNRTRIFCVPPGAQNAPPSDYARRLPHLPQIHRVVPHRSVSRDTPPTRCASIHQVIFLVFVLLDMSPHLKPREPARCASCTI